MNKDITLVLTSCGRFDLLEKTIKSFFEYNTYPIKKCIIVEDSGENVNLDFLKPLIPVETVFLINKENIGQIKSIDRAYAEVDTPYIFHCEDDWEFYKKGFIEKSFEILDNNSKIFTVWLRAHDDTNRHPIITDVSYKLSNGDFYYLMHQNHKKRWCGFTFNPGLRRTIDCMKLYPYSNLEVKEFKKKKGMSILHEVDISIHYRDLGYRAAITSVEHGYVKHIGYGKHIPLPWEIS